MDIFFTIRSTDCTTTAEPMPRCQSFGQASIAGITEAMLENRSSKPEQFSWKNARPHPGPLPQGEGDAFEHCRTLTDP
jgi:hypothetical protein